MSFPDHFSYHFYPVGQGLFASGAIRRHGEGRPRFLWVYDCGTSSGEALVDHGIQLLELDSGNRKRIDLLVLSHFDHDHISGVCRLLQKFKVGTLMLPYMPLAQRLIVAFEEGSGIPDDPLTEFYLNPVAYLMAQEGPGIERILFVLSSGDEGPVYPGERGQPEVGPDVQMQIDFKVGKPDDSAEAEQMRTASQVPGKKTALEFLGRGSAVTVPSASWEFIPYNDDPVEEITKKFTDVVEAERSNLLSAVTADVRHGALKILKGAYDVHFGPGSEERNIISVFLYSGPVYPSWDSCWITEGNSLSFGSEWWWHRWPFPEERGWEFHERPDGRIRARCSILYTGDGYLDTDDRLQKLIRYMDDHRVQRTGVFQVMHHGAEANGHQGVAGSIAPIFSVFSSDPERKKWKHPHASVLRDFWRYGAVQVDKQNSFTASGFLGKS